MSEPTTWRVDHGDCLDLLRAMPDASVDAVVTDPPYGLSFMGKKWDYDVPSVEVWAECLRVLKPGGHLLAFAGTRTQHRMAVRIEDAGFEIRDMIAWVYGSGFPKSHDVSKAIDREAGAEREVIGSRPLTGTARIIGGQGGATSGRADAMYETHATRDTLELTAPATPAARQWQGWGTALKPALEPITMARKPFPGTVAANVMQHGTGAVNVDGCRVGTDGGTTKGNPPKGASNGVYGHGINGACDIVPLNAGRWPANLIHDGSDEVLAGFPETKSGKMMPTRTTAGVGGRNAYGADAAGGFTTMETYGDSGSAARFFYCPKASKADREAGLEDMPSIHRPNGNKWTDQDYRVSSGERPPSAESGPRSNPHPTVKPTALMQYLCRLVTPPGGTVLDPFTGSGSTGKAAMLEGFNFVGFEREAEYVEIARRRIAEAAARPMLLEAVL